MVAILSRWPPRRLRTPDRVFPRRLRVFSRAVWRCHQKSLLANDRSDLRV